MPSKLTDNEIKSQPAPASGAVTLWDTEVKGFGARIFAPSKRHPKGARSFFLNYRHHGIERRYTIGAPPHWTATAARDEAKLLRKRIDRGEDPASAKRERREAPTVGDLIQRYIDDHLPRKAAAETGARKNDELKMLSMIGDALDRRANVADIHIGDLEAMHKKITSENGPVRANRVLSIASKAFSLSLKPLAGENKPWRDQAAGNPCRGVERNPEEGKERFFSEAELAALSDALNEESDRVATDCLRLMMTTGCRPGEAMKSQWPQMDAEPGFWVKRSSHTKQRKVHRAPLTPPALALLARLREVRDEHDPYIFPGAVKGKPIAQIWAAWYAVRDRATLTLWAAKDERLAAMLKELETALGRRPRIEECKAYAESQNIALPIGLLDTRPYDLRHSFASFGVGGGISLYIIGKLLGHTQARTTQRYAHLADDPLKDAANRVGAVIDGTGKDSTNVVRING